MSIDRTSQSAADCVVRGVRDGSGREHDVYLATRDGEVVLSCPTAYWSITFTPNQGHALGRALRQAGS